MKPKSRQPNTEHRREGSRTTGLRLIGGQWGGRRLLTPPGLATRPLLDRIRQSLFDSLGQDLTGWRVADVCAGSGSFGIEAASRGAAEVHLIESAPEAVRCIVDNLASLGNPPACRLHRGSFVEVLPQLSGLDLVFCDPPFPWFHEQPELLGEMLGVSATALADDGRLLLRGEQGADVPALPSRLQQRDRRQHGRSWVALFAVK